MVMFDTSEPIYYGSKSLEKVNTFFLNVDVA